MGDPKKIRKKYKTPRQPFAKDRIEHDLQIVGKYGLRNMKEVWKHSTLLRHFRGNARKLLSLDDEHRSIGERELLGRLQNMGLLAQKATLDDVLSLKIEDFLERRLQTLVHKKGMATTPHHSRQMIVHGHISIGDHIVNSPSYFVNPNEEKLINFSISSPLKKESHKALPANVYKSKKADDHKRTDKRRGQSSRPRGQRSAPPQQKSGTKPQSAAKPQGDAKPKDPAKKAEKSKEPKFEGEKL
ncbi:MAG: 30S ribosomal protein S4 [Asgard group archaeon]|nr:30S ribosomal protein S4 [Asgard group archaeon]